MNGSIKIVFGILLLFIGANMLLGLLGIKLGSLLGLMIAALCLYFGYNKFTDFENPNKVGGGLLMGVGLLILLGKFHFLAGILVALIVIFVGYQLLKRAQQRDVSS